MAGKVVYIQQQGIAQAGVVEQWTAAYLVLDKQVRNRFDLRQPGLGTAEMEAVMLDSPGGRLYPC